MELITITKWQKQNQYRNVLRIDKGKNKQQNKIEIPDKSESIVKGIEEQLIKMEEDEQHETEK